MLVLSLEILFSYVNLLIRHIICGKTISKNLSVNFLEFEIGVLINITVTSKVSKNM